MPRAQGAQEHPEAFHGQLRIAAAAQHQIAVQRVADQGRRRPGFGFPGVGGPEQLQCRIGREQLDDRGRVHGDRSVVIDAGTRRAQGLHPDGRALGRNRGGRERPGNRLGQRAGGRRKRRLPKHGAERHAEQAEPAPIRRTGEGIHRARSCHKGASRTPTVFGLAPPKPVQRGVWLRPGPPAGSPGCARQAWHGALRSATWRSPGLGPGRRETGSSSRQNPGSAWAPQSATPPPHATRLPGTVRRIRTV
jgi:hypothetical protein